MIWSGSHFVPHCRRNASGCQITRRPVGGDRSTPRPHRAAAGSSLPRTRLWSHRGRSWAGCQRHHQRLSGPVLGRLSSGLVHAAPSLSADRAPLSLGRRRCRGRRRGRRGNDRELRCGERSDCMERPAPARLCAGSNGDVDLDEHRVVDRGRHPVTAVGARPERAIRCTNAQSSGVLGVPRRGKNVKCPGQTSYRAKRCKSENRPERFPLTSPSPPHRRLRLATHPR